MMYETVKYSVYSKIKEEIFHGKKIQNHGR